MCPSGSPLHLSETHPRSLGRKMNMHLFFASLAVCLSQDRFYKGNQQTVIHYSLGKVCCHDDYSNQFFHTPTLANKCDMDDVNLL